MDWAGVGEKETTVSDARPELVDLILMEPADL